MATTVRTTKSAAEFIEWLHKDYNPLHLSMPVLLEYHGINTAACALLDAGTIEWKLTDNTLDPHQTAEYYVEEFTFEGFLNKPVETEPGVTDGVDSVAVLLGLGIWLYGVQVIEGMA